MTSASLKIAKWLLDVILPSKVKDDILGDLEEEYSHYMATDVGKANCWLWHQVLLTCSRYLFISTRLLIALAVCVTLCVLALFYTALAFLSYADTPLVYGKSYWLSGSANMLFFEAAFWHFAAEAIDGRFGIDFLIDFRAVLYTVLMFTLLQVIDKKYPLSVAQFIAVSIAFILLPHICLFFYFQMYNLVLHQTGPYIALMWLSTMYLLPICSYRLVSKLHEHARQYGM
ncbi:hypothetical protein J8L98_12355 [Pseudoalteromonas sp. MMG013]|uniref:hypothetical protein n=1 Tax=Pseudoalteromonas sp. MMG013 TaxID=2822687 RepID=UPI001B35F88F|nr:hypothetical protein [Pseudoalteromonas sp. MMG013]MBQ4862481.1 hypothetical protein [Pseudoalteromonas sp. MMG013]